MRPALLASTCLALIGLAAPARAEEPTPEMVRQELPRVFVAVKLAYVRGKGAGACPDERAFRYVAQLHNEHDPFYDDGEQYHAGAARFVVTGSGGVLTGSYTYVDETGKLVVQRTLTKRGMGTVACALLLDDLNLSFSVWILGREIDLAQQALRAKRAVASAAPSAPEPAGAPACTAPQPCNDSRWSVWPDEWPMKPLEPPASDPPKPVEKPLSFRVGSGVWVDWISNDRGSVGFTLDGSVRYKWASVGVEVRGDPAIGTTPVPDFGTVRFARVTGALLTCGHVDPLVACIKGQVGAMLFPGSTPSEPAQLYAAVGVRLGLEFPIAPSRFILRVDSELLPTIDPASITPFRLTAFQVAGLNAGLGLSASFSVSKR
jgi:hypothetical protein